MRIAHVASELAPYSQTGGLAQVAAALPDALVAGAYDAEVAVFSPLYSCVLRAAAERGEELGLRREECVVAFGDRNHRVGFRTLVRKGSASFHFVDCPELFARDGLYGDEHGEFSDNGERFAVLCQAVLAGAARVMAGEPDVFHCHDWQAGMLPALLKHRSEETADQVKSIFTIHNLAYQGCVSKELLPALGLPWTMFTPRGLEFYDQVNMLKAGVAYADATTTVSETYAHEIRTPAFGCNLDGFLRADCPRLVGIRNGLDVEDWNPLVDPHIAEPFDVEIPRGKEACRAALLKEYGLSAGPDQLLVGIVSRLAHQKGLDLVADVIPDLEELGIRLVLVGNGDAELEARFRSLCKEYSEHLSIFVGFDEARAHRVFAGADAFLMPSRFEPCGLGQMAAMRYGTIPIVHAVGGLRDTVIDAEGIPESANGFRFDHPSVADLRRALQRAATMHRSRPEAWKQLMKRGMVEDWSWTGPAEKYWRLYRDL